MLKFSNPLIKTFARLCVGGSILSFLYYCCREIFVGNFPLSPIPARNPTHDLWPGVYLLGGMLFIEIVIMVVQLPLQLKILFSAWWSWSLLCMLQFNLSYLNVSVKVTIIIGVIVQIVVAALYLSLMKHLRTQPIIEK